MGALAPERILRELSDLWVSQAKGDEGGAGVLRACSMTLIALSEAGDDAADLGETLAALMPEHPARTILIRLSGAGKAALEDRVYAQCWMPFGQRRQICCEQVEITVSDAALRDLPPVVLPLTVADLPVILWCRSARVWGMQKFDALAGMATKVVLDSSELPDAGESLRRLRQATELGCVIGDLSWTRLTRWREMLSKLFENRENLAAVDKIARVTVQYPGDAPTASSLYMAAWVTDCLRAVGVTPEVRLQTGAWSGHGPAPKVLGVLLEGDGVSVELSRWEDRMVTTVNGLAQCVNLPMVTEYSLMREELGIVKRDPTFDGVLASALRLAYPNVR